MGLSDVTYNDVIAVTMIWDKIKTSEDFSQMAGAMIYNRLFEIEPETRAHFNFGMDDDIHSNPLFQAHAQHVVDMIDMAISFLGPDLEPLVEDMYELGQRHVNYGVPLEHLAIMEQAVIYTLEKLLQNNLTERDRLAWKRIFHFSLKRWEPE